MIQALAHLSMQRRRGSGTVAGLPVFLLGCHKKCVGMHE
jgi:hypothetical protein